MNDIVRKNFTTTRSEWWVPCDYRSGANWTELMKAIGWATVELKSMGRVGNHEPADDQITVHLHDEHVIVRIVADREVPDVPR